MHQSNVLYSSIHAIDSENFISMHLSSKSERGFTIEKGIEKVSLVTKVAIKISFNFIPSFHHPNSFKYVTLSKLAH